MIADKDTNVVYLVDVTRKNDHKETEAFKKLIQDHGYEVRELFKTKDFYCRDYMPVQVDTTDFVQFVFRPFQYLTQKEMNYITNPIQIEMANKLPQPRYAKIVLDGGNIIKWNDKVIITDRVFSDNAHQISSTEGIAAEIENELKCRVIIIPEYFGEKTGHADGLIRFIDSETVFINDTSNEPEKEWLHKFLMALAQNNLSHINLPCLADPEQETAHGLYINYFQVGKLIVVPQFGLKEDQQAYSIMKDVLGTQHTVVPFNANWIAKHGGVFNCMTWGVAN